jgi:hypothetical protein
MRKRRVRVSKRWQTDQRLARKERKRRCQGTVVARREDQRWMIKMRMGLSR